MKCLITIAFLAMSALAAVPAGAQTVSRAEFCSTWERVCNRTCPGGPNTCADVCTSRRAQCMQTACYYFNIPRARCMANAGDMRMTLERVRR